MAATARISIALPVELKDRMKAAEKSNIINWSKACRQGIESELAIRKRQCADATAAAARMRDSIAESEQHDFVDGTELGHKWAYERAPGYVLRRLQKSVSLYRDVWDRPWERLRMVMAADVAADGRLRSDLFGDRYDELDDSPSFIAGFLQGALEAWQELAPKVEGAHPRSVRQPKISSPAEPIMPSSLLAAGSSAKSAEADDAMNATAEVLEFSDAHPAAQAADKAEKPTADKPKGAHALPDQQGAPAATSPTTSTDQGAHPLPPDRLPTPRRRDAVTLALAGVAEAPEPPDNSPPLQARPKLWIVRVAEDTYTTAREWLTRERPIDYDS
jgi:hypothetical protein